MEIHEADSDPEDVDDVLSDPQSGHSHGGASSSRSERNLAEKRRRDKINQYIQELAGLVPSVLLTQKKLDKTSILRHAAAFLRMYKVTKPVESRALAVPGLDALDVMQSILEEVNGILFVIGSTGKIIYVSDSVEHLLGHSQSELLGQHIFDQVCPSDHDNLRSQLEPDGGLMAERMLSDDSSSDDTGTSASMSSDQSSPDTPDPAGQALEGPELPEPPEPDPIYQSRKFFMRLRQRAPSRSDPLQYEMVYVQGHLRIPGKPSQAWQLAHGQRSQHGHRRRSHESSNSKGDDIVLVAVVQVVREPRVCDYSLLEATREEYVTRHTMDGRIIYCDHRISMVSGYMSEEVAGLSAFRYMHKDDVRWTMVALRHMLSYRQDYGCSCYRLKTKTGEFIYLKTFGYLEKDSVTQALNSFICINVLVSPEEGKKAIQELHNRFSSQIYDSPKRSGVVITEMPDEEAATVSDETLKPMVSELLAPLPEQASPGSSASSSNDHSAPNEHFFKVTCVSKNLPPASIHTARVGITDVPTMVASSPMAQSPRHPTSPSPSRFSASSPQHVSQHVLQHVSSSSENCGRPSVVKVTGDANRASIISGRKRSNDGFFRDDEAKKLFSSPHRTYPGQAPLSVDIDSSSALQTASPTVSPQIRDYPLGIVVEDAHSAVSPSRPDPSSDSPVAMFPNGGWGRSGTPSQTGPAQALSNQSLQYLPQVSDLGIFTEEGLPVEFPFGEENGQELTAVPTQQSTQDLVHNQLIIHQYQLGEGLNAQEEQIANLAQNLNQVPPSNPAQRLIANSLVELKEEHKLQEQEFQKLKRDTKRQTLGV